MITNSSVKAKEVFYSVRKYGSDIVHERTRGIIIGHLPNVFEVDGHTSTLGHGEILACRKNHVIITGAA